MKRTDPLRRLWEQFILRWALRELRPMHPAVPRIVTRLNDFDRAPSPLDPADSTVVGICILAVLFLLALVALDFLGWLQ